MGVWAEREAGSVMGVLYCAASRGVADWWVGYCRLAALLRPPFVAERQEELDRYRLIYHLPKPGANGRTERLLSPQELIGRIAALVTPPRQHRPRYYGVLAPNAPLRATVTALASQPVLSPAASDESAAPGHRSPARYL